MSDVTRQISDRVRGIAAEKHITQDRIADILGVTRGTVSLRFNGRVPYTGPELFVLAQALRVSILRFFPEAHS